MDKGELNHREIVKDITKLMMIKRITHAQLSEELGYSKSTIDKYFSASKQTDQVGVSILQYFNLEEEDYRWER